MNPKSFVIQLVSSCLLLLAGGSNVWSAEVQTDLGTLGGSAYRIDVPKDWNGDLVIFLHGYELLPVRFQPGNITDQAVLTFVNHGYAVAQPGFSAGGWAVPESLSDTAALETYFAAHYHTPGRTLLAGRSFGGFLVMVMLEKEPQKYAGGLSLCGPMAPAAQFIARRVLDMHVVFDYYFPGILPSPVDVPDSFLPTPDVRQHIVEALEAAPDKAKAMREYSGVKTDRDLASDLALFTFILKDLRTRSGGNPFDNRGIVYGSPSQIGDLNKSVQRYAGSPAAGAFLQRYASASGKIEKPLVSLQTSYDPLIPMWVANFYPDLVRSAGTERLFEQSVVSRDGHCVFTQPEIDAGFTSLMRRVNPAGEPASGVSDTRPPGSPLK
jgi:pimeloyl-ACP methyl ester carboxylesterase